MDQTILDALTAGVSRLCLTKLDDDIDDKSLDSDKNNMKMEEVIGAIGLELNHNDHASAAAVSGGLLFDQLETIKTQILREFLTVLLARRHLQQQQQHLQQQQQHPHMQQAQQQQPTNSVSELMLKEKERRLEVKLRLYRSLLSARMIAKLHNERSFQLAPQQLQQPSQQAQQQQQLSPDLDKRIVAMQRIASNLAAHRSKSTPASPYRHNTRFKKTANYVHHHVRPRPRSQPSSPTSSYSSFTTSSRSSFSSPRSSFSSSSSRTH